MITGNNTRNFENCSKIVASPRLIFYESIKFIQTYFQYLFFIVKQPTRIQPHHCWSRISRMCFGQPIVRRKAWLDYYYYYYHHYFPLRQIAPVTSCIRSIVYSCDLTDFFFTMYSRLTCRGYITNGLNALKTCGNNRQLII